MVTNVTVTSTVVVQLTADQNNALLAPSTPGFDPAVEIMFGRSYVYIITSPMVPSDVPLPTSGNGGGAAAAASPCAWLVLLLAALAAVVMMAGSSPALRA
ncbi:hypothetical protein CHLRE_14g616376v5 [Chlamydomonas reinhardtii]|uniref:Uncharacterized protein n=1 Tax=Chlamydomonas reinhardtii TaxID=3055 RepID=A8JAT2_CHLRE|nr:uncharacterized protein CHLRE_14g616376v5 [Chlamydomonas reinhardtii]PNW73037.1 hypothetical protein CHLRE_14g616376v5 [Chlamydomonas reinhardtii]|eukprot:XP_001699015.1 predicted protein [Chlamydomonas reinhardtii]